MLLCAVNRSKPALASRNPQFISRREVRGRIVEGADSNFHFVGAVYARKHGRTAQRAKVTVVGREPPASCLSGHRYFVGRPDREKIAKRAGLLSTHQAVAKADPERLAADLKLHLAAVAAAGSLSHISLDSKSISLCCSDVFIKGSRSLFTALEKGASTMARWWRSRRIRPRPASPRHSRPSHCRSCPAPTLARFHCRIGSPCFSSGRWIAQAPHLGRERTLLLQKLWRSLAYPRKL
jgi:hypothetical protein